MAQRRGVLAALLLVTLAQSPWSTALQPTAGAAIPTTTPTRCTITLAPPTLRVACDGPGPISLAPLHSSAGITTTSFSGAALIPNDPTCSPARSPSSAPANTTSAAPPHVSALVTLCSSARDLRITNSTIKGVRVPSTRTPSAPTSATSTTNSTSNAMASTSAAALAVFSRGLGLQVLNLSASGVTGGSALLLQAASASTSVTVANCTFTNNSATPYTGGGLTLQLAPGTTTLLLDNMFSANSAVDGGGAAVRILGERPSPGTAAMSGTNVTLQGGNVFQRCHAQQGGGGAVHLDGTGAAGLILRVDGNSLFEGNSAAGLGGEPGGGAVAVMLKRCQRCRVEVVGTSRFASNNATGADAPDPVFYVGSGGAVHVQLSDSAACSVLIGEGSQFVNNSARVRGGAVSVVGVNASAVQVAVNGSPIFEGNTIMQEMGGAFVLDMANSTGLRFSMQGESVWTGNTGMFLGGGLALALDTCDGRVGVSGRHAFRANRLVDPSDTPADCTNGGGALGLSLRSVNVSVLLSGMEFEGNQACSGGGLSLTYETPAPANWPERPSLTVHAHDLVFVRNSASLKGGGMLVELSQSRGGALVNLTDSRWEGNTAAMGGGGLAVFANESFVVNASMDRLTFTRNTVSQVAGGGMLVSLGQAVPSTDDTMYTGRLMQPDQVFLPLNDVFVVVNNSVFEGNHVEDGVGGAVYLEGTTSAADGAGAAIDFVAQRLTVGASDRWYSLVGYNNSIVKNHATSGGGVYVRGSQGRFRRATVEANTAAQLGGGIYVKAGLWSMEATSVRGNRAADSGGGICGLVDDNSAITTLRLNRSNITNNSARRNGGGLYLQAGLTTLDGTNITGNTAGQQGGGIAFINTCRMHSTTCNLSILPSSLVAGNSAVTGGAIFLTSPAGTTLNSTDLLRVVPPHSNSATYASGVSMPPNVTSIAVDQPNFTRPSSTGNNGLLPVVASVGQASVQVTISFCSSLAGGAAHAAADTAYLLGPTEVSRTGGVAKFESLRLVNATSNQTYCLQVQTPDYPIVTPATLWVTIRDCIPGEIRNADGCMECQANQYSFNPANDTKCSICPTTATCSGGPSLVPAKGFWHSAPNSAAVQPCPNRKACQGDRELLQACQAARNCSSGSSSSAPGGYRTLQCSQGYSGNLCSSCRKDQGYGQAAYMRCGKCMSRARTVVLVLAMAAVSCGVVVWVSLKSQAEAQQQQQLLQQHNLGGGLVPQRSAGGSSTASARNKDTLHNADSVPLPWNQTDFTITSNTPARSELELSDVFKVLVVHVQYLSIIGNLLVDWPWALRALISAVQLLFVTSNSDIVSWNCLGDLGNGTELNLRILVPLSVIAIGCSIVWVRSFLRRRPKPSVGLQPQPSAASLAPFPSTSSLQVLVQGDLAAENSSRPLADSIITTAMVGLFLFYSVLVSSSLAAFSCLSVDDDTYWIKDMSVKCWTGPHLQASLVTGLVGTLLFCLIVPSLTIWWLSVNRSKVANPAFRRRYGFLYRLYRPKYCYWEGVVCLQTTALVAVDLFGQSQGTFYQLVLLVLILVLNTTLVAVLQPFRSRSLQLLYASSTVTLLLTCLGVQSILKGYVLRATVELVSGAQNSIVVVVLLLNAGFISVCIYLVGWAAVRLAKRLITKASTSVWLQKYSSRLSSVRLPAMSLSSVRLPAMSLHKVGTNMGALRHSRRQSKRAQQPSSDSARGSAWERARGLESMLGVGSCHGNSGSDTNAGGADAGCGAEP